MLEGLTHSEPWQTSVWVSWVLRLCVFMALVCCGREGVIDTDEVSPGSATSILQAKLMRMDHFLYVSQILSSGYIF